MRRALGPVILLALLAAGCWTKTSSAGSFVTDIDIVGERMVVMDCDINFQVTKVFDNRESDLRRGACGSSRYALPPGLAGLQAAAPPPPAPAPAPPRKTHFSAEDRRRCARPLAVWRTRQPAERRAAYGQLPAVCQKMIHPEELER